jgi:ribosome-associated protein
MPAADAIQINAKLAIPLSELRFSFDRSPGPGGQNVNKVNTRAELRFGVTTSPSLTLSMRGLIGAELATRMNGAGELILRSSRFRSQTRNRADCLEKFAALLAHALRPPPPKRRPSRPTRASTAKRLDRKKAHSQQKTLRTRPDSDR